MKSLRLQQHKCFGLPDSCFLEQKQGSCMLILHRLLLVKYVVCLSRHEGIRFNIIPGRAGQFNKTANIIAGNVLSKQQKQADQRHHVPIKAEAADAALTCCQLWSQSCRAGFLWVSCFNKTQKPINISLYCHCTVTPSTTMQQNQTVPRRRYAQLNTTKLKVDLF